MTAPPRIDPELFTFQFGDTVDRTAIEAILDRPRAGCVTLFADFCSYSLFVEETAETESALASLAHFLDHARTAILRSGGMIDRVQGDGILAVWGLTDPSSDCPWLEAAQAIRTCADEAAKMWERDIDRLIAEKGVRIGIAFGTVTLLSVPTAYPGFSLLGECVNLAARLCSAADPNEILVSHRLVERTKIAEQATLREAHDDDGLPGLTLRHMPRIRAWRVDNNLVP